MKTVDLEDALRRDPAVQLLHEMLELATARGETEKVFAYRWLRDAYRQRHARVLRRFEENLKGFLEDEKKGADTNYKAALVNNFEERLREMVEESLSTAYSVRPEAETRVNHDD